MAAGEEKLKLVLSAVDKTVAPLRALNRRIESAQAPVRKLQNAFRALAKEARLDKLGAGLSKLAGWARTAAVAATGAATGLVAFALHAADSADQLAEFTRMVGMSVEEFQSLQWAAKRAGIENETFSNAMRTLSINVGRAQAGTGKLAGLLKKVAPTVLKQIQGTKSTGEALEVVLSAMRRLPDVTKRNTLATTAFGDAQLALLATLSPDDLKKFREEADRLGMVMSSETATAAEEVMDNVDALTGSVKGLAARIAESLFPDIKRVTGEMLKWIQAHKDLILTKGKEWILKLAEAAKAVAKWLIVVVPQVAEFVERMGGVKTILGLIVGIKLASFASEIYALAGAFGALGVSAGPVMAVAAALAGIYLYRKELADFFGLSAKPTNLPNTAPLASPPRGLTPPASFGDHWSGPKVDVSGTIGIALTSKQRAEVTSSQTINPAMQFELLSRGRALGAQ